MTLLKRMSRKGSDDLGSPDWPIAMLEHYLDSNEDLGTRFTKNTKIWEPACGDGNIVNWFENSGYPAVMGTDIKTGSDFFSADWTDSDCIITNPPFSLKDKFLARCYELGKPFALLLPITAIGGKRRGQMYRKYADTQFLILPKRVDFQINGEYKNKPWFQCCWIIGRWQGPHHKTVFL